MIGILLVVSLVASLTSYINIIIGAIIIYSLSWVFINEKYF